MNEPSVKLRLSVWRDYNPTKPLIYLGAVNDLQRVLDEDILLQQEVFSWQTKEDPFGGVADEAVRNSLKVALYEKLSPGLKPRERDFSVLALFIEEARSVLTCAGSEWTTIQDPIVDDDRHPYEANALLSLLLQMQWLHAVFSGQPGVSVSVR